ncbi:uncharacterized protein LOC125719040 isoform X2 [Brienomyrus brachyistius]|uniref:uncharacterized protein LOC125719040 isoform X2 n=1 Tax=Brienomyrus brachyistius TaxID=42636 RepID=UPI0020B3A821|nr:uncharacterized protein LOC125719040 isoform X2 [Brienomyrus brachyistius]
METAEEALRTLLEMTPGIQHAKEAVLEYGKCPHCAEMDWSWRINRLANVQEFMHRENQLQRKCESARCDPPPTTLTGIPEVTKEPITTPSPSTLITLSPAQPLSFPVMLTVNSPASTLTVSKGACDSPGGLPQPLQSTFALSPFPPEAKAHKRRHSSRAHSRLTRRSKRNQQHKCKCCLSCWDSLNSCSSARGATSWWRTCAVKLERQLMESMQQKLNAQQKSMQARWSMMEKRIGALERLTTDSLVTVSAATQTIQEDQKDHIYPDKLTSIQLAVKNQEQPHVSPSGANEKMADNESGEDLSLLPEISLKIKDMLIAVKLQELMGRATKYLGIDFPHTTDHPNPTIVPEFEDSVQSTWSNPACSRPFKPVHAEMYRLHVCQAPAYDQMPQISSFMSAIFQAVTPMENKEVSRPAKSWRFAEALAERAYQTAGMLARTANYLRYLSDYQKRLLLEASEGQPPQRLVAIVNELKLIAKFTLQLSTHQAELSGRAMAWSVAIRRQVWLSETNCKDDLQATVVDLPFVVSHATGTTNVSTSSNMLRKEDIL